MSSTNTSFSSVVGELANPLDVPGVVLAVFDRRLKSHRQGSEPLIGQQLFEAQRDYANSRYTYLVNALLLKQAAGTLRAEDISEVDTWLKPSDQVPEPTQGSR